MKSTNNLTHFKSRPHFIMVGAMILALMSCGDEEPTPQQKATALITRSAWKIKTVSVDAVDQTSVYSGLVITFTSNGYTTINGGVIWPATGTWSFKDKSATVITRDDGVEITLQELTDTSLKTAFSWSKTTLGSGRAASVSGQHIFTFSK